MTEDLELARRYIASHKQLLRMFRHYNETPEGPEKQLSWDEEELDREIRELEAELKDERRD